MILGRERTHARSLSLSLFFFLSQNIHIYLYLDIYILPRPTRKLLVSSSEFRNCTSDKQIRIVLCRIFLNVVWMCVLIPVC